MRELGELKGELAGVLNQMRKTPHCLPAVLCVARSPWLAGCCGMLAPKGRGWVGGAEWQGKYGRPRKTLCTQPPPCHQRYSGQRWQHTQHVATTAPNGSINEGEGPLIQCPDFAALLLAALLGCPQWAYLGLTRPCSLCGPLPSGKLFQLSAVCYFAFVTILMVSPHVLTTRWKANLVAMETSDGADFLFPVNRHRPDLRPASIYLRASTCGHLRAAVHEDRGGAIGCLCTRRSPPLRRAPVGRRHAPHTASLTVDANRW